MTEEIDTFEDRKVSTWRPTYPAALHPDVVGECQNNWANGRPYTNIRVLRGDADNSDGASCCHGAGCPNKVEAVQYSSAFGDPLFYCEEHAVEQQERDVWHYDSSPAPQPKVDPRVHEEVQRILKRYGRKRRNEDRTTGPKEDDDL